MRKIQKKLRRYISAISRFLHVCNKLQKRNLKSNLADSKHRQKSRQKYLHFLANWIFLKVKILRLQTLHRPKSFKVVSFKIIWALGSSTGSKSHQRNENLKISREMKGKKQILDIGKKLKNAKKSRKSKMKKNDLKTHSLIYSRYRYHI